MPDPVDLSIVIGFRDWGLDRLTANVRMHLRHAARHRVEVIVSDYGSSEPDEVRAAVEAAGGLVVHTPSQHRHWNRSAALNAGVRASSGRVIITTDADILFTPATYDAVAEAVDRRPMALYLVQCRDLPQGCDARHFHELLDNEQPIDFPRLERVSTLRPRWGMGGLAAFSRRGFAVLNGYEERMEVWGKEDTDFAKRFSLSRMPARWLSRPGVGIYHIWHEPSRQKAMDDREGARILARNQHILENDTSRVRNRQTVFMHDEVPVSVVIPTFNRPDYLKQALQSCQAQTFPNFEVLVVENGGASGAAAIIEEMDDSRIRLIRTEKRGAAAARNIGVSEARGRYLVITDDDDMMVSTRIEDHLAALTDECHGTYGGWIDFDHDTGAVLAENTCKTYSFDALWATGRVIVHAGLMLETRIFSLFPYDETLSAGIDYGLLLKLSYHGMQLSHTGRFALLRRMHGTNMTHQLSDIQKGAAQEAVAQLRQVLSPAEQERMRRNGSQAPAMACSNRDAALAELALYHAHRCPLPRPLPSPEPRPERTGRFDPDWYSRTYPDVGLSGLHPLVHFRRYGQLMGRRGHAEG